MVGDVVQDIRIPHRTIKGGDLQREVIEGAFRVLDAFEIVNQHTDAMKTLQLEPREQTAFATAALALRYGQHTVEDAGGHRPLPILAEQLNEAWRAEDVGNSLWATFQRVPTIAAIATAAAITRTGPLF